MWSKACVAAWVIVLAVQPAAAIEKTDGWLPSGPTALEDYTDGLPGDGSVDDLVLAGPVVQGGDTGPGEESQGGPFQAGPEHQIVDLRDAGDAACRSAVWEHSDWGTMPDLAPGIDNLYWDIAGTVGPVEDYSGCSAVSDNAPPFIDPPADASPPQPPQPPAAVGPRPGEPVPPPTAGRDRVVAQAFPLGGVDRSVDGGPDDGPEGRSGDGGLRPGLHTTGAPDTDVSLLDAVLATAVLLAVGSLAWLVWRVVSGSAGAGLFTRLRPDRLLAHPTRRAIHDAVQDTPGLHFQETVRRVGASKGVVEHHLRKLEEGGLVVRRRAGGYACFFPAGHADWNEMAAAGVLKAKVARAIVQAISERPDACAGDVGARVGASPALLSYHLKRLREAGLVEVQVRANFRHLRLSPLGRRVAEGVTR